MVKLCASAFYSLNFELVYCIFSLAEKYILLFLFFLLEKIRIFALSWDNVHLSEGVSCPYVMKRIDHEARRKSKNKD